MGRKLYYHRLYGRGNFIVSFTFPVLLKKLQGGYTFLIYAIMCVLCFIFVFKCPAETKGKSLEQIEKDLII
jgi:hypothetical protein